MTAGGPTLHLLPGDAGCWREVRTTAAFDGRPALFLDRDGVIVEEKYYLHRPDEVCLLRGAAETIAACNGAGVAIVVVTNQSGVGRGYFGWDAFANVQERLLTLLAAHGARIDMVLACACHADARPPYDVAGHPWRKPAPGMLREAGSTLGVDLARSWLIGDSASDLAAARTAGLSGAVHVATGHGRLQEAAARALAAPGFTVRTAADLGAALPLLPFP